MNWIYIIGGIFLLFGALQLWFWVLKINEKKRSKLLIKSYAQKGIPKLTKKEQFKFLDSSDYTELQKLLKDSKIDMNGIDYFIDVEPDEYLEYLRKNNPPRSWLEDTYGEVRIEKESESYKFNYYSRGKLVKSMNFRDYDIVLRYLVYERLIKIGFKYKKKLKKSYYAQHQL